MYEKLAGNGLFNPKNLHYAPANRRRGNTPPGRRKRASEGGRHRKGGGKSVISPGGVRPAGRGFHLRAPVKDPDSVIWGMPGKYIIHETA